MFDWSQFEWHVDPETHRGEFRMTAPPEDFFPVGEIEYRICNPEWREEIVEISYVPAEWETLDRAWLNHAAPSTSYELARWINEAIRPYIKNIGRAEFFDRIEEVDGPGQPPPGVRNTTRGIRRLVKKEGFARLVTPYTLEFLQPQNVFQGGFNCSCECYFDSHAFGLLRKDEDLDYCPWQAGGSWWAECRDPEHPRVIEEQGLTFRSNEIIVFDPLSPLESLCLPDGYSWTDSQDSVGDSNGRFSGRIEFEAWSGSMIVAPASPSMPKFVKAMDGAGEYHDVVAGNYTWRFRDDYPDYGSAHFSAYCLLDTDVGFSVRAAIPWNENDFAEFVSRFKFR